MRLVERVPNPRLVSINIASPDTAPLVRSVDLISLSNVANLGYQGQAGVPLRSVANGKTSA